MQSRILTQQLLSPLDLVSIYALDILSRELANLMLMGFSRNR